MLVLNRSNNESITLTIPGVGDVVVYVKLKDRDKRVPVDLVVDAPLTVKVLRTEIKDKGHVGQTVESV